jgi:hypothetical protein
MTRQCYVSNLKQVGDPYGVGTVKWELVEDREFIWDFMSWGVDYNEDGQYSVAIIEAECGKVAMVRADWIRFLPDSIEKGE